MPTKPTPDTVEGKLDEILVYLDRLDRRDRLRTWGGFIRGIIALIPIIILIWTTWYFFAHADEMMAKITRYAAEQAAGMAQPNDEIMQQFRLMFPGSGDQ